MASFALLIGPAATCRAEPPDRTAPGGSEGRWIAGLQSGFFDGVPAPRSRLDSNSFGLEFGMVGGYQTVRLLRYRYIAVRRPLDFPATPHRSRLHQFDFLYRLYLMPDHSAGPLLQFGPSLVFPSRHHGSGGLTIGTGMYVHLNTQVTLRTDVLFDRITTGKLFSREAAWGRELALALEVVFGMPLGAGGAP